MYLAPVRAFNTVNSQSFQTRIKPMPSNKIERNGSAVAVVKMDPANDEEYDQTARALLTAEGFDPDDINRVCDVVDPHDGDYSWSTTPMIYFCCTGNFKMCRYLFFRRGADCRKTDENGWSPMVAAACGHLEIVQWLSQVGGAKDDIRKRTEHDWSPLSIALFYDQFDVVYWLIQNGALALRDDMDGGGIDNAIMRSDLRQDRIWREDRRYLYYHGHEKPSQTMNIYSFF